ncbi:MAG: hypothetical protein JXA15_10640 [Spirochaetales bacterium]|nr:hypothetical protein [Spirochaetales bacterium]
MKRKYLIPLALLALAVALLAGCVLPSYQLSWTLGEPVYNSVDGYISVNYQLENVGWEELYDAFVKISMKTEGTVETYEGSTPNFDLSVGEEVFGVLRFYSGTGKSYTGFDAWVSVAGWNVEDESW